MMNTMLPMMRSRRVAPWRAGVEGIISFTGHSLLAIGDDISDDHLAKLGVDGFGGATQPSVLLELAGPTGWIDSLDVLLAQRVKSTASPLVERPDLLDHPRVGFARALREDVKVFGRHDVTTRSVATLGRGIGGLLEMSVELDPGERRKGTASDFIRAALAAAPSDDVVVAAVAPGNAASLRSFLAAGFVILGSSQLLRPARP